MRILVVEDDAVTRRLLAHHLVKWGHDVTEAQDGDDAWNQFQQQPFPLVVSDWIMPGMDGLELVSRIRSGEDGERPYLVILTAKQEKRDLVAVMDAGADDFLSKPFDPDELRVRVRAGARMIELQQKIDARNAELRKANNELGNANRQMKQDLEAAARIQQTLLPTQTPRVDGASFAWLSRPCDELAGDTLNLVKLNDHEVAVYVLDVTGHGVQAALLSVTVSRVMSIQGGFSVLTEPTNNGGPPRICSPAEVAWKLNERFPWDIKTLQFFTMVYGVLDTRTGVFRYVSAGHPGPLHVPAIGDASIPKLQSYPIGLAEQAYKEHEVTLAPGDRLYLYSDGVVEALDDDRQQFGEQRFIDRMVQSRERSLDESIADLVDGLQAWQSHHQPADDISLLAVERAGE